MSETRMIVKDLGEVTAYAYAVSKGYTGTEEEFATLMASYATVGQQAVDAKDAAVTARNEAEAAKNESVAAKDEAVQAAGDAAKDAKDTIDQILSDVTDSLEQIDQNTLDIADLKETTEDLEDRKANVDGYYPDMTVGNAEQLNSSKFVENSEPYTLRTSGGTSDIGNREYVDAVVGGTLAWNQAVRDEASENSTDFADVVTVTDAVEDAAGVKVKIEPVQDLHGYDHPWPAGGGKNLSSIESLDANRGWWGTSWSLYVDMLNTLPAGSYTLGVTYTITDLGGLTSVRHEGPLIQANGSSATPTRSSGIDNSPTVGKTYRDFSNFTLTSEQVGKVTASYFYFGLPNYGNFTGTISEITLESGTLTSSTYSPYSNICPITGRTAAKVTRTGKNLFDKAQQTHLYCDGSLRTYSNADMTSIYVPLLPNTTYTFSQSIVGGFTRYSLIDALENMTDIYDPMRPSDKSYMTHTSLPFTFTNTNRKYLLCTIYRASVDTDKTFDEIADSCQLEYGSTATDYEPYAGNTYDITLPTEAGTVYGGELTVNADGSGSLVVDRASEEFSFVNPDTNNGFDSKVFTLANATTAASSKNGKMTNVVDEYVYTGAAYGASHFYIGGRTFVVYLKENTYRGGVIQVCYPLATPITYTLTASQITTLLGQNNVWADTGDLALTYTGTDEHLVLESGKKYLSRISGTDSMLLGSGQEITAAKGTDNVFDLTKMFGTAVADYVYGQGAAFFRKWFGKTWYPYNAGELKHVEGLQSHDMVGFNQWDEEWELGYYNMQTGEPTAATNQFRTKNFIPVVPNATYYFCSPATVQVIWFDANKEYVGCLTWFSGTATTPNNVHYIKVNFGNSYGTTYKHDICISLAHNNSRNGEYEPYEKHSYPLDSTVVLRGIPKVGSNGVYWDGDRYLPDGTVERRYGVVDLGTQVWGKSTFNGISYFVTNNILSNLKKPESSIDDNNFLCTKYLLVKTPGVSTAFTDKTFFVFTSGYIYVRDDSFTDLASFKSAMSGVYLVYELATPTTETAQPYHSTQWVSDWGTEEFVSTGIVPVGSETRYPANLRDKLQHLPDAASGNGSYLITQTDGQMVLTPFPAPPSTAGNYVLKATVTNGVATYTWEVAT